LLVLLAYVVYLWLLPKPLPNIPHNPVTTIWADIPEIMRFTAEGKKTFEEYIEHIVNRHGSLSQVSNFKPRSRRDAETTGAKDYNGRKPDYNSYRKGGG
jgi:hypothetical protein